MAPRTPLRVFALSWFMGRAGADRAESARSAAEGMSALNVDARAHASVAKMAPRRWSAYEKVWEPLQEASDELEKSLEMLVEQKLKIDEQVELDEKELVKIQVRLDENQQKDSSLQGQIDRLKAGRVETMRNLEKTMQEYPQFKASDDSAGGGGGELLERRAHKSRNKKGKKGKNVKGNSNKTVALAQVLGNDTHRQASRGRAAGNRTHRHARRGHGRANTSSGGRNQSSLLQGGPAWGGPEEAGAGTPNYEPLEETSDQVEGQYAHLRAQLIRLSEQIADDEREKGNAEARQAENQRELNSLTSQLGMLRTGKHDSKLAMLRTLAAMAGARLPEDPGVKVPEGEKFKENTPNTMVDPETGEVVENTYHSDRDAQDTNADENEDENNEDANEHENPSEDDQIEDANEHENPSEDDQNEDGNGDEDENPSEDDQNEDGNGDRESFLQESPGRTVQDPRFYHALRQSAEAIDKHDGMLKGAADRIRQQMASDRALIEKLDERLTDNKAELKKVKDQIAQLRDGGAASQEEMRKTMELTAEKGLEEEAKVNPLASN